MPLKIPRTIMVNGKTQIIPFRQFESLEDAKTHFDEAELLIFLNSSIIDHDRKKLRKLILENKTSEVEIYKKNQKFVSK